MDHFQAIQLNALYAVTTQEDSDYSLRYIFRWYSKTFATPLHTVDQLPLDDVLQAYFESMYEGMEEPKIEREKQLLTETDEERKARRRAEDADQAQLAMMEELTLKMKGFFSSVPKPTSLMPGAGDLEPQAPEAEMISSIHKAQSPLQPGIKMTFLNEDSELDFDRDSFGLFGEPD